jgi:hypothetical protein
MLELQVLKVTSMLEIIIGDQPETLLDPIKSLRPTPTTEDKNLVSMGMKIRILFRWELFPSGCCIKKPFVDRFDQFHQLAENLKRVRKIIAE